MKICDKTLRDVINEINENIEMKSNETLTPIGYYIASELFIAILESVEFLHKQNPQIIQRDLKLENILLKRSKNSKHYYMRTFSAVFIAVIFMPKIKNKSFKIKKNST